MEYYVTGAGGKKEELERAGAKDVLDLGDGLYSIIADKKTRKALIKLGFKLEKAVSLTIC